MPACTKRCEIGCHHPKSLGLRTSALNSCSFGHVMAANTTLITISVIVAYGIRCRSRSVEYGKNIPGLRSLGHIGTTGAALARAAPD